MERRRPSPSGTEAPIFLIPTPQQQHRALHAFTATPSPIVTVLSARRLQRVAAGGNTPNAVSIFTSSGVQALTTEDYKQAVAVLKPDIAIPLSDLTDTNVLPNAKRALRMAERADEWLTRWFDGRFADQVLTPSGISTFAPVLPIPYSMQWEYLEHLSEDYADSIQGLAVYDVDIMPELQGYPNLLPLPRLSLAVPATPHHILRHVSLGIDIFFLPFLNAMSDSGIALTFTFPPPEPSSSSNWILPLGIDLASTDHRSAIAPMQGGCSCYTCTHHHRAYVHHLLQVREMLGWTLLQIHNHAVADAFFAGIRAALAEGEEAFEAARMRFSAAYEPELSQGTALRPRARGYHFKSEAGNEKINKAAWGKLKDGAPADGESMDIE